MLFTMSTTRPPATSGVTTELSAFRIPRELSGRSVGYAMLATPKVLAASARVDEVQALFEDDHVHAALLVDDAGRLVAVVEPADLVDREGFTRAAFVGGLHDRTVRADAGAGVTWWAMRHSGRRRLAVVDDDGRLLGLLCLKASGRGFCSAADVEARRQERGQQGGQALSRR